jgi:hypothetical protein
VVDLEGVVVHNMNTEGEHTAGEEPGARNPNPGATRLLQDPAFLRRAQVEGEECAVTAAELEAAAGGETGGALSISPAEDAGTVKHPTAWGDIAESNHHQVFTDGAYVFDPLYSGSPVLRGSYESTILDLNGPTVDIAFFPATPDEP